jgi:fumarate reductase subunit C
MLKTHAFALQHGDTNLWMVQAFTGFAMFFLGSVHLYILMTNADKIGPFASSDRMWSDGMWPLYLLLLIAVELHGSIGLYRLCMKWGWCNGEDARAARKRLKKIKWAITAFFLTLGLLTLAAYVKIGMEHQGAYGERYHPTASVQTPSQEVRS